MTTGLKLEIEFTTGLSLLTEIPLDEICAYAKHNNVLNIVEHPGILAKNMAQYERIEALRKMLVSYRTLQSQAAEARITLNNKHAVESYFSFLKGKKDAEIVVAAFLDTKCQLIQAMKIAEGGINACLVDERKIVEGAIMTHCASVVLAHNHPSGMPQPSEEDKLLTKKVKNTLEQLGIFLVDHIIIGDWTYSMDENNDLIFMKDKEPANYEPITLAEDDWNMEM